MQLRLALTDVYAAPGFFDPTGDLPLNLDEARARELYSFLPSATSLQVTDTELILSLPAVSPSVAAQVEDLRERATRRAKNGDHNKAVELYSKALSLNPLAISPRRDLAMCFMADGKIDRAEEALKALVLLAPADPWSWVILGNLTSKERRNFALAERYFRRGIELNPTDPYAWNGLGAMLMEKKDFSRAREVFHAALQHHPGFANSHYGLAVAAEASGDLRGAYSAIEGMFAQGHVQDARSLPTFRRGSKDYRSLALRLAVENFAEASREVTELESEAASVSGFPIRYEEKEFETKITGQTQMAWKYERPFHLISVRESLPPVVKLHIRAHEISHILLEAQARQAGTNRWFTVPNENFQKAAESMEGDLQRLIATGASMAQLAAMLNKLIRGLGNLLFNLPLDMTIESQLWKRCPALRPAQVASISLMLEEAVASCTAEQVVRSAPRVLLQQVRTLCFAYALFVDHLLNGVLMAGEPYESLGVSEPALNLYRMWEEAEKIRTPGAEYVLVDQFADELGLRSWYRWKTDS